MVIKTYDIWSTNPSKFSGGLFGKKKILGGCDPKTIFSIGIFLLVVGIALLIAAIVIILNGPGVGSMFRRRRNGCYCINNPTFMMSSNDMSSAINDASMS